MKRKLGRGNSDIEPRHAILKFSMARDFRSGINNYILFILKRFPPYSLEFSFWAWSLESMRLRIDPFLAIAAVCWAAPSYQPSSLLVEDTPAYVRPYVLPHLVGHVVAAGNSANRFPITAASSGGAFTLLTTSAGRSELLSVPPHSHKRGYETFFLLERCTSTLACDK